MDNRPPVFLDSSVIIARIREAQRRQEGPASAALAAVAGRRLLISVVTVAEVLEGSSASAAARLFLNRFSAQPITWAVAERCALIQARTRRRLGENDAWIVAQAEIAGADVLGRDREAFSRLGAHYLRF